MRGSVFYSLVFTNIDLWASLHASSPVSCRRLHALPATVKLALGISLGGFCLSNRWV